MQRLETARLILRPFESGDAQFLLAIFSDPKTSRFWFTPDKTIAESQARIANAAKAWEAHGFGDWAVVEKTSGSFLGMCGLHYISGMSEVNLGYILTRSCWGRGYGTEACLAAVSFGLNEARLSRIVGVTHPDNAASIKVLKKCSMTFWKDIVRGDVPRVAYSRTA